MNKRLIRLTKDDLIEIIKNGVYNILKENVLFEYAVSRSNFVENVHNLSYQIIENWCLVHYCTLTNRIELKKHWQGELYTHMQNIMRDNIKANKSQQTKYKAIIEGFERSDLFNGYERILEIIYGKFDTENIIIDDIVSQVAKDCSNSIKDIANVLSMSNKENLLKDYIKNI